MASVRRLPIPRSAVIAVAVIAVAAAGWSGWWWLAGTLLRSSLDAWIAAEREQGGEVRIGSLELGGFPLRLRATVTDLAITRRDGSAWHGPEVVIEAPLWAVNALRVRLGGRQEVRFPLGLEPALAQADGGDGSVRLGGGSGFTEAHVALTGVSLRPSSADGRTVTAARLDVTASLPARAVTEHTETGLMVMLAADKVLLPLAEEVPLGPAIESLALTARVLGAPPRVDAAGLAGWSQDGGTVELDTASLHWGALALGAEGTLALDRELQPIGALTAEITGFAPAIDTLVATGWVKAKQGQTAKAVLAGLSPRKIGEPPPANPTAKLPISLHDRFVHLGPFRLLPLPRVEWQRPAAG